MGFGQRRSRYSQSFGRTRTKRSGRDPRKIHRLESRKTGLPNFSPTAGLREEGVTSFSGDRKPSCRLCETCVTVDDEFWAPSRLMAGGLRVASRGYISGPTASLQLRRCRVKPQLAIFAGYSTAWLQGADIMALISLQNHTTKGQWVLDSAQVLLYRKSVGRQQPFDTRARRRVQEWER